MNVPWPIFVKLATRTPEVFCAVVRETIRSRTGRWLDYRFGRGRALSPRYIDLKLTNRCNLRCGMCGQWGERGTFHGASAEVLRQELELPVLRSMIRQVAHFRPMFYLWGGEPFLHRSLIPLLAEIKSRRLICAINTNGTYLADTAEELVRLGVDNLLVSIDGPAEIHDKVRGVAGTFNKVMAGIERIQRLKRDRRLPKPFLTFVTTINQHNVTRFPEVYDLAAKVGADFVGLQFGTFTTEACGAAYEQRMRERLGCQASSWRGFVADHSNLDIPAIQEGLRQVRSKRHSFGTYFIPDLQPEDLPGYYSGTAPVKGCRSCIVPWMRTDILPNGDVYPCIDFPDYIVGNVHDTPLMDLWNSPRYVQFRNELKKGLLPICGRCSTLYEF